MSKVKSLLLAGIFSACCASFAKDGEDCVLSKEGVSAAVIVISAKPTKAAQFAAFEFQEHLGKITGAKFEIVGEGTKKLPDYLVKIYVGETEAAKSADPQAGHVRERI